MRNDRAWAAAWFVAASLSCAWPLAWPAAAFGEANVRAGVVDAAAAGASANANASAAAAAPRIDVVPTAAAREAANELMRLQEDTLILKAQLKKLDAQAQVAERQQTLHRMGGTVSSFAVVSLVATQSLGKHITATVATSDGAEFDVASGDTLPNGIRVAAIRAGAIVLAAPDGRRTTLTVSTGGREPARSVAQTAPGSLPTIPMPAR